MEKHVQTSEGKLKSFLNVFLGPFLLIVMTACAVLTLLGILCIVDPLIEPSYLPFSQASWIIGFVQTGGMVIWTFLMFFWLWLCLSGKSGQLLWSLDGWLRYFLMVYLSLTLVFLTGVSWLAISVARFEISGLLVGTLGWGFITILYLW